MALRWYGLFPEWLRVVDQIWRNPPSQPEGIPGWLVVLADEIARMERRVREAAARAQERQQEGQRDSDALDEVGEGFDWNSCD